MRVAVTGSSGLIGSALVPALRAQGHDVVRLVRREPTAPDEVHWRPSEGQIDTAALGTLDAAINLAGAGVGDRRWNAEYKDTVLRSRVDSTRTLVTAMAAMDPLPAVLVSGSAQGIYGDRGDDLLTEQSRAGDSFLASVCREWEAATAPAADAGIRVVLPRTSLVMTPSGGAFGPVVKLVRLGGGGPMGSGTQWWSWITLPDTVAALLFMLANPVSGPVNLCSPDPARNRDLIKAIAAAFNRPALVPAPAFALRAAVGEFAGEILASARLDPTVLRAAGFGWSQPDVAAAARWLAGPTSAD